LVKYFDRSKVSVTGVAMTIGSNCSDNMAQEVSSITRLLGVDSSDYGSINHDVVKYCSEIFSTREGAVKSMYKDADIVITWGSGEIMEELKDFNGKTVLVSHCAQPIPNVTLKGADALVGCSLSALGPFFETTPSCVSSTVIYNGADVERVQPQKGRNWQRRQWDLQEGDVAIGFLSRQSPEKNYTVLADAIDLLPQNHKAIYYGQLQGCPGAFAPEITKRDRVQLYLPISHIGDVLAGLDVLAVPTHHEAFSLAILEAWLAGVPVISTPIGNEPEMALKHGSLVTIVPFDVTPEELANAIHKACSKESKIKADKAKSIARKEFTCQEMAKRWEIFLETLA